MFNCIKCGNQKNISEFPVAKNKLGHKKQCRQCWSEYMRQYYKNNPKKYSRHKKYVKKNDRIYKRSYARHHISEEDFLIMVEKYEGKCYSCKEKAATCIDHDHSCCPGNYSCGLCVRGMLCNWCNSALGHTEDSVEKLQNLIEYLNISRQ